MGSRGSLDGSEEDKLLASASIRNPDLRISIQSLYTDHNILSTILVDSHILKQNETFPTNIIHQKSKNNQLSDVILCEC
jgi:hypothetical protein